jgi:hypothetical protein
MFGKISIVSLPQVVEAAVGYVPNTSYLGTQAVQLRQVQR